MGVGSFVDQAVQTCIEINKLIDLTLEDQKIIDRTVDAFNRSMDKIHKDFRVRLDVRFGENDHIEVRMKTIGQK